MVNWFMRNQKSIGYSIGGLNILSGILNLALGNYFLGSAVIGTGVGVWVQTYLMEK